MTSKGPSADPPAGYGKAILNILEDFSEEQARLREAQKAVLNILEDLDVEKRRAEAANVELQREIGERRLAEAALRQKTDELARSNAELEQFAYVASHDLQEPLRMISSYTQLLEQRYDKALDERARKYIFYAVDGAIRMQRLITDLLSYSRVGSRAQPLALVDSHSALGEALRNLSAAVGEAHALVTNADLPMVWADRSQLAQLFQNLIGNAIKFHGGQSPRIHVSADGAGDGWVFCVRDNGIGIDPQYFDRIFAIFQRLHSREEYPGTGIGLALCKRIVERHGGRIWVESEPGKGSAFFFSLRGDVTEADRRR
jgi:light-regulated signal transduction histidine kinase (bacteriophytochrome)